MMETIVDRLRELYKELLDLNGLQYFETLIVGSSNLRMALTLIKECEKLVLSVEKLELIKLNELRDNLTNVISTSDKVKGFECNCEITMRYLKLHTKSLMGLDNRLPELKENIEIVLWVLQNVIKSITKTQEHPHNVDLYYAKKKQVLDLFHMIHLNKCEYDDFHERFDCLLYYLENKRKTGKTRLNVSTEVLNYLNGTSDMFMDELQWEDEDFIVGVLGGSTEQIQNLLRNSLKEVMEKRGFEISNPNMPEEKRIKLSKEQENLLEHLDKFQKDLVIVREGIKSFESIKLSTRFHKLQKFEFNLHELKIELDEIQEQNDSSDEDL